MWTGGRHEEATYAQFDRFFEALSKERPDTVVTHDVPSRLPVWRSGREESVTPNALENALEQSGHQPRHWFFGHHHLLDRWCIDGTNYFGCGLEGECWVRTGGANAPEFEAIELS